MMSYFVYENADISMDTYKEQSSYISKKRKRQDIIIIFQYDSPSVVLIGGFRKLLSLWNVPQNGLRV